MRLEVTTTEQDAVKGSLASDTAALETPSFHSKHTINPVCVQKGVKMIPAYSTGTKHASAYFGTAHTF